MKYAQVFVCAAGLAGSAMAADHGPVFGYATPVNSQREFSFDTESLVALDPVERNFHPERDWVTA